MSLAMDVRCATYSVSLLVCSEPDRIDCSPLVLWFLSISLDVDIIRKMHIHSQAHSEQYTTHTTHKTHCHSTNSM